MWWWIILAGFIVLGWAAIIILQNKDIRQGILSQVETTGSTFKSPTDPELQKIIPKSPTLWDKAAGYAVLVGIALILLGIFGPMISALWRIAF